MKYMQGLAPFAPLHAERREEAAAAECTVPSGSKGAAAHSQLSGGQQQQEQLMRSSSPQEQPAPAHSPEQSADVQTETAQEGLQGTPGWSALKEIGMADWQAPEAARHMLLPAPLSAGKPVSRAQLRQQLQFCSQQSASARVVSPAVHSLARPPSASTSRSTRGRRLLGLARQQQQQQSLAAAGAGMEAEAGAGAAAEASEQMQLDEPSATPSAADAAVALGQVGMVGHGAARVQRRLTQSPLPRQVAAAAALEGDTGQGARELCQSPSPAGVVHTTQALSSLSSPSPAAAATVPSPSQLGSEGASPACCRFATPPALKLNSTQAAPAAAASPAGRRVDALGSSALQAAAAGCTTTSVQPPPTVHTTTSSQLVRVQSGQSLLTPLSRGASHNLVIVPCQIPGSAHLGPFLLN